MSVQTLSRPQIAPPLSPELEGAPVYDVEGHRLGLVDSVDHDAESFTLVQAGYVLGLVGGTFAVPGHWVRRAEPERVDLVVPASDMEELPSFPSRPDRATGSPQ